MAAKAGRLQRTQPAAAHGWSEQAEQQVESICAPSAEGHVNPILHGAGERGGGLEHDEQHRKEDEDANHGVQQHAVDAVGQGDVVDRMHVEAAQYAGGPVESCVGPRFGPDAQAVGGFHVGVGCRGWQCGQPVRNGRSLETCGDRVGQSLAAVSGTSVNRDDRHAVQQMGQSFRIDAAAVADGEVVHGDSDRDSAVASSTTTARSGTGMPDAPVNASTATCSSGLIGDSE